MERREERRCLFVCLVGGVRESNIGVWIRLGCGSLVKSGFDGVWRCLVSVVCVCVYVCVCVLK